MLMVVSSGVNVGSQRSAKMGLVSSSDLTELNSEALKLYPPPPPKKSMVFVDFADMDVVFSCHRWMLFCDLMVYDHHFLFIVKMLVHGPFSSHCVFHVCLLYSVFGKFFHLNCPFGFLILCNSANVIIKVSFS